jgi:hypothetical protein
MSLGAYVEKAMSPNGTIEDLEEALLCCIKTGGQEGLRQAVALAECDYDGCTFKWEHKKPSAVTVLCWGEEGLSRIAELSLNTELSSSRMVFLETLCHAADMSLNSLLNFKLMPRLYKEIDPLGGKYVNKAFTECAKRNLYLVVANIEIDEPVPNILISTLSRFKFNPQDSYKFNLLFSGISSRWFRLTNKGLSQYTALIEKANVSEEEIHTYLAENPHMLDPFYLRIWSKPRLGESLVADFVLRSVEDNYVVV